MTLTEARLGLGMAVTPCVVTAIGSVLQAARLWLSSGSSRDYCQQ